MTQRQLFPPPRKDGSEHWGKAAEDGYHKTVGQTLATLGYATMHVYALRTAGGDFRTPTTTKGWPDWTATRGRFVLSIEIKGYDRNGRATPFQPGQKDWLARFSRLAGGRAWVFRPTDDWPTVVEMMRHPENAPRIFGWSPDE